MIVRKFFAELESIVLSHTAICPGFKSAVSEQVNKTPKKRAFRT